MKQFVVRTFLVPTTRQADQRSLRTRRISSSVLLSLAVCGACSGDPAGSAGNGASGGEAATKSGAAYADASARSQAATDSGAARGGTRNAAEQGTAAGAQQTAHTAASGGTSEAAARPGAAGFGGAAGTTDTSHSVGELGAPSDGGAPSHAVGDVGKPGDSGAPSNATGEGGTIREDGASGSADSLPFACSASKSPMFATQEVLNMRISADFTKLNSAPTAEESGSVAKVQVTSGQAVKALTANVIARGNSRFRYCQVRPFALKFDEKQKDNVFEHLGKSVKFVSHCVGKDGAPADTYKADSPEVYEQRVVMEHTVYQLLAQLGVPSLNSRLVKLTYEDTQTQKEETHLAFVLEPEDEMAKRCGLVKPKDANLGEGVVLPTNRYSGLLMHLLNSFIIQYDWSMGSYVKNLIELIDLTRQEKFYAPYDFDLAGIFRPDYIPNNHRTLEENRDAFADWLRRNQSPALFREVELILQQSEAIRKTFQLPEMTDANRGFFSQWFSEFMTALQDFRSCEGHSNESTRTACYVSDDHGDRPETAAATAPSELTTRIEPPGDVDVFAFDLQAGTLYTLGGMAQLELRDARGNLQAKASGDAPASFRAAVTATYHLSASLGDQLVVSPFHAGSDHIARNIFLYPDDAGNSVETAVPLSAGQTWKGTWELAVGSDEDWFLVHADASTSLHVTMSPDDPSLGYAQVIRRDASAGESPTEADLGRGDNDLSALFGAPGDYIVKLVEFTGLGATTSYSVELR